MSHAVYGLLLMIGIITGSITFATAVGATVLVGHKREVAHREKLRRDRASERLESLNERAEIRAHELEIAKIKHGDAKSGTLIPRHEIVSAWEPTTDPRRPEF